MRSLKQHTRQIKLSLKKALPSPLYKLLWLMPRYREWPAVFAFLFRQIPNTSFSERLAIVNRTFDVGIGVYCPHTAGEVLSYIETILSLPADKNGVLVEAGCFKGGSTAKFSLAASAAGRQLVVFDSFEGLPEHEEPHEVTIFGGPADFPVGSYSGALEEVTANVAKYGNVESCRFIKGWFDDTMPSFQEPIAAAYIDVDLVSSTKTCLKHLYPLLEPGGTLYSHDGHLPLVCEVFRDERFWRDEVGCQPPTIIGLGRSKLIKIIKPPQPTERTIQQAQDTLSRR